MKNRRIYVLGAIATMLLLYLLMFFNTNSIIRDVKDIMHGNVEKSVTKGTPLNMYNRQGEFGTTFVDVSVTRLFVLHNFYDGYMWVRYSEEGFDNSGDRTYGSWGVFSKWKIHKENGHWTLVEIEEDP